VLVEEQTKTSHMAAAKRNWAAHEEDIRGIWEKTRTGVWAWTKNWGDIEGEHGTWGRAKTVVRKTNKCKSCE